MLQAGVLLSLRERNCWHVLFRIFHDLSAEDLRAVVAALPKLGPVVEAYAKTRFYRFKQVINLDLGPTSSSSSSVKEFEDVLRPGSATFRKIGHGHASIEFSPKEARLTTVFRLDLRQIRAQLLEMSLVDSTKNFCRSHLWLSASFIGRYANRHSCRQSFTQEITLNGQTVRKPGQIARFMANKVCRYASPGLRMRVANSVWDDHDDDEVTIYVSHIEQPGLYSYSFEIKYVDLTVALF